MGRRPLVPSSVNGVPGERPIIIPLWFFDDIAAGIVSRTCFLLSFSFRSKIYRSYFPNFVFAFLLEFLLHRGSDSVLDSAQIFHLRIEYFDRF